MSDFYKPIILPEAQQDIRRIVLYIAQELFSPQAALNLQDAFREEIQKLSYMPTRIKPIDEEIIIKAAKETGKIITFEEHNVIGGLGDAVCEVVSAECPVKVTKIGVNDVFGYSGPAKELLEIFGLCQSNIEKVVENIVMNEKR